LSVGLYYKLTSRTIMKNPIISIVVPCYNEEAVLRKTIEKLQTVILELVHKNKIDSRSFITCVDDGSRDQTWQIIKNAGIKGVKLSYNAGHQNALTAGLLFVKDKCDAAISIDADLQDDESLIEKFIDRFIEGNDLVYGVRKSRKRDTFFKKFSAKLFYRLMIKMGVEIVADHADYRLASKKVLIAFEKFPEVNLFLRGIFPLIGFNSDTVYYDRKEREAGKSKYPLKKMLSFAFDGITSFSVKPLRIITALGFTIFLASIFASFWVLVVKLIHHTVHGWASIVLPIYFISGIQLLSLGIIGEYLGKIYLETKRRPKYIIEKTI